MIAVLLSTAVFRRFRGAGVPPVTWRLRVLFGTCVFAVALISTWLSTLARTQAPLSAADRRDATIAAVVVVCLPLAVFLLIDGARRLTRRPEAGERTTPGRA